MNAKEQFAKVVRLRNWHGIKNDTKAQRAAGVDKHLATSGRLSYEKCAEWLHKLGYKQTQDEIWEKD